MYSPYYVAPYVSPYTTKRVKYDYINPNVINNGIKTETHKINGPFSGQIHFYDSISGRPGPVVDATPRLETYVSRPCGLDVDVYGDKQDVNRLLNNCKKRKRKLNDSDNENIIIDTDGNVVVVETDEDDDNDNNNDSDNSDDGEELNIIDHGKSCKSNTGNFKLVGNYLVHDSIMTSYIGCGVVILEVINGVKTIMLGSNSKDIYGDFGGGISYAQYNYTDVSYSLEKSASINATSKTSKLFLFSSTLKGVPKVDIRVPNNELYRLFFVEIKGLSKLTPIDLTRIVENNSSFLNHFGSNNSHVKNLARFNFDELYRLAHSQVWTNKDEITLDDIYGNKNLKIHFNIIKMFKKLKNKSVYGYPTDVTIIENYNGNDGFIRIQI